MKLDHITFYYRRECPFCVYVKRFLLKNDITVNERNISSDRSALKKLVKEGGKQQVPAITIEHENGKVEWLYESQDIVDRIAAIAKKMQAA
ncbi:glutaredoxin family protein [Agarilytica rhodophyticola]|uniref:glutaredoxin family protein n=1 Tax=Agarilytica rhodophyticola TaxID=1737490 RepID=UPI000B3450B6|nr:glutaredoxin family protein [Agarilytica rhodophyticola]